MLTQRAKYAVKALLVLAAEYPDDPVLIADVAERGAIPRKFLEGILLSLKNRGLLHSRKGRGGGYRLARPPDSISLGEVIRLMDGPLALIPCASLTAYRKCDECEDERTCGIRLVMKDVRDATSKILDNTTLADVLRRVSRAQRA